MDTIGMKFQVLPWVSNGSALISNYILYSPQGCIFGDMSSFNSILSNSITLTGSSINIKDIPQVSKSSAPSGYLTKDSWKCHFRYLIQLINFLTLNNKQQQQCTKHN
jgi:hypothetical protein